MYSESVLTFTCLHTWAESKQLIHKKVQEQDSKYMFREELILTLRKACNMLQFIINIFLNMQSLEQGEIYMKASNATAFGLKLVTNPQPTNSLNHCSLPSANQQDPQLNVVNLGQKQEKPIF